MHLVLSGPYEVLYNTSVDIWSFGCLLLTVFIGKSGPLRQRGVCYVFNTQMMSGENTSKFGNYLFNYFTMQGVPTTSQSHCNVANTYIPNFFPFKCMNREILLVFTLQALITADIIMYGTYVALIYLLCCIYII